MDEASCPAAGGLRPGLTIGLSTRSTRRPSLGMKRSCRTVYATSRPPRPSHELRRVARRPACNTLRTQCYTDVHACIHTLKSPRHVQCVRFHTVHTRTPFSIRGHKQVRPAHARLDLVLQLATQHRVFEKHGKVYTTCFLAPSHSRISTDSLLLCLVAVLFLVTTGYNTGSKYQIWRR